ncbi:MAG: HepT-like ribonuclease domain-containing protein [Pseudomonadota bacterium]
MLIHDYLNVDLHSLWITVTRDVPPLAAKLRPLLD